MFSLSQNFLFPFLEDENIQFSCDIYLYDDNQCVDSLAKIGLSLDVFTLAKRENRTVNCLYSFSRSSSHFGYVCPQSSNQD